MGLGDYHKKRNFKKTPEPKGDAAPSQPGSRTDSLKFVIQLHDATRKHYDLRLELDGTMKSWAVPKGPSLDPLERRLAVKVEDHPIEYNDFEGVIPTGNYGAGTVMIWDEGTYEARNVPFPAKDQQDALRRAHTKGHLTVILHGKKLQGEFALIRLAKGDGKSWLLVKKHDRFVNRDEITNQDRSARSGRTLGEIAASAKSEGAIWNSIEKRRGETLKEKNARAPAKKRVAASGQNAPLTRRRLGKAFKDVAERCDFEIPKPAAWLPAASLKLGKGQLLQPVFDGYRMVLAIDSEQRVKLLSKTGVPVGRKFPMLIERLESLPGHLVLDGMVVALDENGEPRRRGHLSRFRPRIPPEAGFVDGIYPEGA